jgi:alcohol dehydrogenase (cytochrome c)
LKRLSFVVLFIFASQLFGQNISTQDLLNGLKDPGRWLTYSGDYSGERHSPLDQITPANVQKLAAQWIFQTEVAGKFEATPIVIDGVMFVTGSENRAWAIDARTGREIWRHRENLPATLALCCGKVNRGFAVFGGKLYMAALDANLVALDLKTGNVVGGVNIDDYKKGYSATAAPLIAGNKVIVGIAGADYGTRGFIDAFDVNTGGRAWRFWTVPKPGEPGGDTWTGPSWERGGGSSWLTGTYDPDLKLIYWGTGNPGPNLNGAGRKGDNLYTNSLVAIEADTGKLRWHYQFTPHDTHDWDAAHIPVLADLTFNGVVRKVVMVANRNGFFYTLDRTTGELLVAKPYVKTTWATKIGADGRPIVLPDSEPTEGGTFICPDMDGGTNWMSPSYNPQTHWMYVMSREVCATYYSWADETYKEGESYWGGNTTRKRDEGYGALRAIDPLTGDVKWEFKFPNPSMAGTLSTASGLVFAGDVDGNFMAFDAATGKNLWHFQTGAPIYAAPVTFTVQQKQYVVIPSGSNLLAFALPD